MSNKINPMDQGMLGKIGNKIGESSSAKKVEPGTATRGKDAAQPSSTGDTVELTSRAKLVEQLEKSLAKLPEVDAARVDAVRAQIENGEYQVDADKIAEAILRLDREIDDRT